MHLWLDRIGLVCQFLSFWFVAPELIGEDRLQGLSKGLASFFSTTLFLFISLAVVALAWSLAFREGIHWFHRGSLALLFSSVVLIPKLLLYKRFKKVWLPALIQHLSDDERFRRGLLMIGGALLTIGVALQILATF